MVDATASFEGNRLAATEALPRALPADSAGLSVSVADGSALAAYAEFCRSALFAPAQSAAWILNWAAHTGAGAVVATPGMEGRPVFAGAGSYPQRTVPRCPSWWAPCQRQPRRCRPRWLAEGDCRALRSISRQSAGPGPISTSIALERLLPDLEGTANPLASFPHFPSPNLSLAVDLAGSFDALLSRASGKRKRKKHRSQMRKFDAAGSIAASRPGHRKRRTGCSTHFSR
jgi:CelD/BcsL family acetyltransferase involved in cellulose biosynthesis